MSKKNLEKTANHWNDSPWDTQEIRFWTQLPRVQRRLAVKESGRPDKNWIDHTLETYFKGKLPLARCLSLGCGRGRVERLWAERGAFEACDAFDISPTSILQANDNAIRAGFNHIEYAVKNIDQIELPEQYYDAAWAVGSAHHFFELEHVFAQVACALKTSGIFILHEYVGPKHFQFNERQSQVIESCLKLIPANYRLFPDPKTGIISRSSAPLNRQEYRWVLRRTVDKIREGTLFSTFGRYWRRHRAVRAGNRPVKETALPTLRSVLAVDPSEAVRSADIIPVLKNHFDIVEHRPLGGSILQFLLADIAANFQDETGEQLLDIFFQLEDILMECGDLESDFAYIVARPRLNDPDVMNFNCL